MSLTDSSIQEQLSIAYCQAVVSMAGYAFQQTSAGIDYGIDATVNLMMPFEGEIHAAGTVLALQVKATKNAKIEDDYVSYTLKMDAYRRLKSKSVQPKILVVYAMPPDRNLWLDCTHDGLMMKRCAYWIRATDIDDGVSNTSSVVIKIPKENLFDVDAIDILAGPQKRILEET